MMSSKAAVLRELLYSGDFTAIAGVHDALCARAAEAAGYPALWASGLGISTVNGVPDAGVLGMREVLHCTQAMDLATGLPILVDCDAGFGDVENVRHLVRHFEAGGVAGVCMEDKRHPKRNSLGDGLQELESVEVFAEKIRMAKDTQRTPDFVVVARTEALIAGAGVEEASERAYAYQAAGADAILVHSRARSADEVAAFALGWRGAVPLLALPTTFPQVTERELALLGFAGCIYANQALRACLRAMRHVYHEMRVHRSALAVEAGIAPVADVLALGEPPRPAAPVLRIPALEVGPRVARDVPAVPLP